MRRERAAERTEAERERYGRQMLIAHWGVEGRVSFLHAPETPCACLVRGGMPLP
jgi:hypothetical protein